MSSQNETAPLPRMEIEDVSKLPRMEVECKWFTFRFYSRHENHYDSSLQMMVDANQGTIHTLNGAAFFRHVEEFHKEFFLVPCVRYIWFDMMEDTLRGLKSKLEHVMNFEEMDTADIHGRVFYKIRLSLKGDDWEARKLNTPMFTAVAVYGGAIHRL